MALPKINQPTFDLIIPSTKKRLKVRPMTVKEEKLLLIAKSSTESRDHIEAIRQVVNNCIVGSENVDMMCLFDLEYLFLKIRANSVSNIAKAAYKDHGDGKIYQFDIDLNTLEVKFPESMDKIIKVTDTVAVEMRYPLVSFYLNRDEDLDLDEELVYHCLGKIYDSDQVYKCDDSSREELIEFIEGLPAGSYEKMMDFVTNLPSLYHRIEYVNKEGTERKIVLSRLEDFFPFY